MERSWLFIMKIKLNNIQSKLFVSYGILLAIISIIFSILYSVSKHTIQKAAIESSYYTAQVMAEKLNSEMEYLLTVRDQIYSNTSVNKYINAIRTSTDSWSSHYYLSKLNTAMDNFTHMLIRGSINSEIIIFSPSKGLLYYSWTSIDDFSPQGENSQGQIAADINALFAQNGQAKISCERLRSSYNPNTSGESYLYFYQAHKNPYSGLCDYYIIIGVPKEGMEEYFFPFEKNDYGVIYVDDQEYIIYSNLADAPEYFDQMDFQDENIEDAPTVSYQGKEYIQLSIPIGAAGWTLVHLLPVQEILSGLNHWSILIVLALVFLAMGLIGVCIYLNRSIIYPIRQLDKNIQKVKAGETNLLPPHIQANNEISRLGLEFYDMIQQLHVLQQQMLLKEEQKRDLEIEALQAQINPHFMYNTIGSIKMLLRLGRNEQAISSLSALVDVLKNTISRSDKTISLEEELNILKSYIYIQQRRYSEFQFEVTLPEALKEYHIMRFLIQPLIENSLLHGYGEINQNTKISVSFSADYPNRILNVSIRDNGCGITPEKLQEILTTPQKTRGLNGIGIKNIMERIRLNYGSPYSIQFQSSANQGTTIVLVLPLIP